MQHQYSGSNIIETSGLVKKYGKLKAVDNVSISVKKGEIYGFLGLNGAGKTTAIRMMLGMIKPDSGEASVCGEKIKSGGKGPWGKVGYLVEMPYSYPELTVKENLLAVSRLRGLKGNSYADKIISLLQLNEYVNIKARNLSLGNNQRLGLAKAMIHRPEVLILDEPSNGLDPSGIVEIRELLRDFAYNRGITVFISSHNLSEIYKIATRIGIIHRGALVEEINSDKLESILSRTLILDARDRKGVADFLVREKIKIEYSTNGMITISDPEICEKPEYINSLLVGSGFIPYHLHTVQEDLESYFLRIIGEKQ